MVNIPLENELFHTSRSAGHSPSIMFAGSVLSIYAILRNELTQFENDGDNFPNSGLLLGLSLKTRMFYRIPILNCECVVLSPLKILFLIKYKYSFLPLVVPFHSVFNMNTGVFPLHGHDHVRNELTSIREREKKKQKCNNNVE